ncbi:MAG: carboxypeptidase-like regulatory domain-containing protein [Bacteroidetes bacterium]|nr:carboxypeptidase-like regulatory domain-containing protein [Bacteroidota bacterium]
MKGIFILIHFCSSGFLFAQNFKGVILDSATNAPLPYVNIGIVGGNNGTVSNEQGVFELLINPADTDTLRASYIGYAPYTISISEFRKHASSVQLVIRMTQRPVLLDEIVVKPLKGDLLTIGNRPGSKSVNANFSTNMLGCEIGTRFTNNRLLIIDSVRLCIAKCLFDTIYLRVNIYKIDHGKFDQILKSPVYISLTRKEALKKPVINITEHYAMVEGDFAVTIEIVRDLGEKKLAFYADLTDNVYPGIYRNTSQANWNFMKHKNKPAGISLLAYTRSFEK